MPPKRKPAAERRVEIVETALALLEDVPAEHLSMALIAERIGISQPALFRHFPTKGALWAAILSQIESSAQTRWQDAMARACPPIDRLRGLLEAQLELIHANPSVPALLFSTGKLAAEDVARPIHLRVMTEFRRHLLQQARAAVDCGALSRHVSPEDTVALLMGLVQGLVLRWSLTGHGFDLCSEGRRLVNVQLCLLRAHEGDAA